MGDAVELTGRVSLLPLGDSCSYSRLDLWVGHVCDARILLPSDEDDYAAVDGLGQPYACCGERRAGQTHLENGIKLGHENSWGR